MFRDLEQAGTARGDVTMVPVAPLVNVKANLRSGVAGPKGGRVHEVARVIVEEFDRAPADELDRLGAVEMLVDAC